MGFHQRCGGVSRHAISRVRKQFNSPLENGEIRKILRSEKNASKTKNGYLLLTREATQKLRVEIPSGKELVAVVSEGVVTTVLSVGPSMQERWT